MRMRLVIPLVLLLGSVILFGLLKRPAPEPKATPPTTSTHVETLNDLVVGDANSVAEPRRPAPGVEKSSVPVRSREGSRAEGTTPETALPESARGTQEILNGILQLGMVQAPLTPEQAQGLNAQMRGIVAQGQAGLPAIKKFLEQNVDLTFGEGSEGKTLNFRSLRAGLLDALSEIGGPEAMGISRQVLQTTSDPGEIAQIARKLEAAAPGEYRAEILEAARESFALATKAPLPSDAAPLFRVLQEFSDSSSAAVLQEATPQFRYYSALALAGLPDGQGVTALVELAQKGDQARPRNDFAFIALSQIADKYPAAQEALIAEAKQGTIPDGVWRLIAQSLAGEKMQIGQPPAMSGSETGSSTPLAQRPTTYHNDANNQTFYSLPDITPRSTDEINQRVALVDQLLSTTSNPAAVQNLQRARSILTTQ